MNTEPPTDTYNREQMREFVQKIRSDHLPQLAQTLQRMMPYYPQIGMFEVDLILDANVVISELLWLARKREKPEARTGLMEVMDCKVVRAYAPHFLKREIATNLPEVAAKQNVDVAVLESLWDVYRTKITFVAVGGPPRKGKWRDPKDVPYLRLQRRLACPIVSEDADVGAMGGKVIRVQIFGTLRGYSRAAAVEYQLKASGALSVALAAGLAEGVFATIKRLPTPVLWGGAILSLLLLLHPKSRKKILEVGEVLIEGGARVIPEIAKALDPLLTAHAHARDDAQRFLADAQKQLPA